MLQFPGMGSSEEEALRAGVVQKRPLRAAERAGHGEVIGAVPRVLIAKISGATGNEAADRDKDRAVLPLLRDIAASRKKLSIRR